MKCKHRKPREWCLDCVFKEREKRSRPKIIEIPMDTMTEWPTKKWERRLERILIGIALTLSLAIPLFAMWSVFK